MREAHYKFELTNIFLIRLKLKKVFFMRRGLLTLTGLAILTILATSGINKQHKASGITGSSTGCSCHGGSAGSVSLKGLPTHVKAGATYPFTLVYAIGTNMTYWGLDLKVTGGTLTAGTGMRLSGTTEVTHSSPLNSGTATSTYTYNGMKWSTTGLAVGTVVKFTFATLGSTSATSSGAGKDAKGTFSDTISTTNAPVEFESVNAAWLGDKKVNIAWKTATETNSDHFDVERSFNGETYISIATVKAAGVSDHLISYTFNDVLTGANTAYYRIKEVDKDGTPTYSEVRTVSVKPVKNFVKGIYPNPVIAGQSINVQYVALENGKVNIELYNCLGKKMTSLSTEAVNGENNIKFNLGRFVSPGIYYVIVNNGIEKIAQLPVSVQ